MKRIGERIAKVEVLDGPDKGWPPLFGLIGYMAVFAAVVGLIAYGLRLQETKPLPNPDAARAITPPLVVKERGYVINVGRLIVRGADPSEGFAPVSIIAKGKDDGWLDCKLNDAKGVPLGGGAVAGLLNESGANMAIQGPLLSEGKLDCHVIDVLGKH